MDETAACGPSGEDPGAAALAFWSLMHGIYMNVRVDRVPDEHVTDIDALVSNSFAYWRA